MTWPLRKGNAQGLLEVAKKWERERFGNGAKSGQLVKVPFSLFHMCLSQWIYYLAREFWQFRAPGGQSLGSRKGQNSAILWAATELPRPQ